MIPNSTIDRVVMQTIQAKKCEAEARLAKVVEEHMHFSVTPLAEMHVKESLQDTKTGYEVCRYGRHPEGPEILQVIKYLLFARYLHYMQFLLHAIYHTHSFFVYS